MQLEFVHPIVSVEEAYGIPTQNSTIFRGIAITKGLSLNGRYYDAPVLSSISTQLSGKPVMYGAELDADEGITKHRKANKYVVGAILDSWLGRNESQVWYEAKVEDTADVPDIRQRVKRGLIRFASIGGVGETEEAANGRRVKSLTVTHLSLVAVPGDPNAEITEIIQETYGSNATVCFPVLGCTRLARSLAEVLDGLRELLVKDF